MKNYLLLALFFGLSGTPVAAQQVVSLSLSEAVDYAVENNPTTKNARLELLISKATIKETTARGLPQINGAYNLDYNPKIPVVFSSKPASVRRSI